MKSFLIPSQPSLLTLLFFFVTNNSLVRELRSAFPINSSSLHSIILILLFSLPFSLLSSYISLVRLLFYSVELSRHVFTMGMDFSRSKICELALQTVKSAPDASYRCTLVRIRVWFLPFTFCCFACLPVRHLWN